MTAKLIGMVNNNLKATGGPQPTSWGVQPQIRQFLRNLAKETLPGHSSQAAGNLNHILLGTNRQFVSIYIMRAAVWREFGADYYGRRPTGVTRACL